MNVYGKNNAYTAVTDLYDSSKQGTLLGTIVCGTSTELTISGDYTFVGLRSNSGAMYLDKIEITWDNGIVKTDPSFNNLTDVSVDYGSTLTLTKGTSGTPYFVTDGTVTLSSSNTNVVGVSGLTITPVAVGTALITVNTTATTAYNAGTVMFPITVNAPEGKTEAAPSVTTVFTETFAGSTGNNVSFGGTQNDANGTLSTDNSGWNTGNSSNGANGAAKFGSSSKNGSATTPSITSTPGTAYTLTFKAAPWNTETTTMNVTATGATISGISTSTMTTQQWNEYTATLTATASSFTITFSASKNRFFLDDVVVTTAGVTLTATLNDYGYATFCSEYPLDFSDYETADFSAWQITGVNGSAITFEQVTDKVKGGTGLLLKGDARATVTLSSAASDNELDYNLLYGTLAPTFVETDTYYGLSGQTFVKVNPGTVSTGKALLPASVLASDVKVFTFVFEEDPDGIESLIPTLSKGKDIIYNVAGQRLSKMQKGINIVNGKKVMVK